MMILGAALATLGGVLWSFGSLGKRIGVEGASNDEKKIRATCTAFVYALATSIVPVLNFVLLPREDIMQTFDNPDWTQRIPVILICGAISGAGNVLGTLAFAYSAGENSALVSMIENGTYTASGALIIALWMHQYPPWTHYVSGVLILLGIVLAQGTFGIRRRLASFRLAASFRSESKSNVQANAGGDGTQIDEHKDDCIVPDNENSGSSGSSIGSGEEADNTMIAPSRVRKRVVFLAMLAGVCWGFGPLGKAHGVADAPNDLKRAWTTSTYLIYMACTNLLPVGQLICADSSMRKHVIRIKSFQKLLLGVLTCGIISGFGGLVSTYAFSESHGEGGPIISMIENGVYTVFGAVLIALMYREVVTARQLFSALMIVVGVIVAAAA